MNRQLFSWDPQQHPQCACPRCGWQTFWQYDNGSYQCESCRYFTTYFVAPKEAK